MKKPSIKGMKNTEYLGHFKKDKHIQSGHNTSGKPYSAPYYFQKGPDKETLEQKRQKMMDEFNEEISMGFDDLAKKMKKQNIKPFKLSEDFKDALKTKLSEDENED